MDLALALGGGGARGLAHFGVLQVLLEAGIFPKALAGTSMGAIVGGVYSVGQDLNRVLRLLSSLDLREALGLPPSTRSVAEEAIVESLIGRIRRRPWWEVNSARTTRFLAFLRLLTQGKRFEELPLPFVAVACDLLSGEEVRIREGPVYLGAGASAAIPGLLGPIRWKGRFLIDGGVVNNIPVEVAAELGRVVLAVDVSAPLGPEPHSLVDVALRAYDITARALQEHQIRRARERLGENFLLIKPEVGHIGLLDFALLPEAVEAGRAAAQTVISELKNR
jgi:NTE family protein